MQAMTQKPSPCGRGLGEGLRRKQASAEVGTPHPDPLPMGEGASSRRLLEGGADEQVEAGVRADLSLGFGDGHCRLARAEAQIGEGGERVLGVAAGGDGRAAGAERDASGLVLQFVDDALGELGADALGSGDHLIVAAGCCAVDFIDRERRKDGERDPRADSLDGDQQPEPVALGSGREADQADEILGDQHLGVEHHLLADRAKRRKRPARGGNEIADAADVDHREIGAEAVEQTSQFGDHALVLACSPRHSSESWNLPSASKGNEIPAFAGMTIRGRRQATRRAVARWWAWVIATASASAASAPAIFAPGSSRWTIAWTCAFSAPPVRPAAFLTSRAAYSPMPIPACAAASRITPRAWPSFSVDCGFS